MKKILLGLCIFIFSTSHAQTKYLSFSDGYVSPKKFDAPKKTITNSDSYIEVDLEAQEIYMYLDGELVFRSDCVTGDVWRRRETPKGVFYVEYKQRNRVLKGEDYRTPVSYWMHFYNHCGFHDASWRRAFGDEIYLRDGSHGCVNMPPAKAKELYDLVYKGIPVIVY